MKPNDPIDMGEGLKLAYSSENANPQKLRSSTAAAANPTPSGPPHHKLLQTPQGPSDCPQKAQKRAHTIENDRPHKRLRENLPIDVRPIQTVNKQSGDQILLPGSPLSRRNLKKLERELAKFEMPNSNQMEPYVTALERVRKRPLSRQESSSDLYQDTASAGSQRSSILNSVYRYEILAQFRIFVRPEPPPNNIQAQMDLIFAPNIPENRAREISGIAKQVSQKFIHKLRGAEREDDFVELVYDAIRMMHADETFESARKADWDTSLKPRIQQNVWNREALGHSSNDPDRIANSPNKQQRVAGSIPSPHRSSVTMPPPTAVLQPKSGAVKTPRPDFTIGLRHSTVSTALRKRGLNKFQAEDFLNFLQREQLFRSDPTQNFLDIRCPILVIEGKAYATGKTTFEAQNQAAVSGSCMVNLQQQLIDLFNNVFSVPQGRESPLAFSICTEGPHMELWVHYAASEYNMRSHYMNIIRTCYGSLHHELENFLLDVERLMQWTKEGFLAEIADRLCELASHATRG